MSSDSAGGGYDAGYAACPCFWGERPGIMLRLLTANVSVEGFHVLDAGCGEGRNAIYLAERGATVVAVDISAVAIANAKRRWPAADRVTWKQRDINDCYFKAESFDIVIAYGLLHCMPEAHAVFDTIARLQRWTKPNGYNAIAVFNDRVRDLSAAHAGFKPCLLPHLAYLSSYRTWQLLHHSDANLTETHPHNQIRHTHAVTWILAKSVRGG